MCRSLSPGRSSRLPAPVKPELLAALLLLVALTGCRSGSDAGGEEAAADSASAPPVVEITAGDYAFAAPDTIPAGWVTFRMSNRGRESHHFHLDRLPEGRTVAEWREAFEHPTDSILRLEAEGEMDPADVPGAFGEALPEWGYPENLETRGGVGLVGPGRTGQATHRVDPGQYVMICVIDAPGGRIHASLGMVEGLVVVGSSVERSPSEPDATVRGAGREIRMVRPLSSGTRTVEFRVEEVPGGLRSGTDGHYSVWLARLDDATSTSDVSAWDYENPAPYESLGGFEYLPPDEVAYVTADLQPGRYAWVWFYRGMDLSGGDEPLVKAFHVE